MAPKPLRDQIETRRMEIERLCGELFRLKGSACGGHASVERLLRIRGIRMFRKAADRQLVNSPKGVAENFVFCLMHYFRKAQGPGKDVAIFNEGVRRVRENPDS